MKTGWGIVGCGDIANKAVAPAINAQPDSELVALFSNTPERAEEMRVAHGAARAYSDLNEILADDEIDAIYVASPVHRHVAETVAAAEAGKHVLCEKPMTLDVAEAERMIAACDAAGVQRRGGRASGGGVLPALLPEDRRDEADDRGGSYR